MSIATLFGGVYFVTFVRIFVMSKSVGTQSIEGKYHCHYFKENKSTNKFNATNVFKK